MVTRDLVPSGLVFRRPHLTFHLPWSRALVVTYFVAVATAFVLAMSMVVQASATLAGSSRPLADKIRLLVDSGPKLATRSEVVSADGTVLAVLHGEENRVEVALRDVSPFVVRAAIAIEDARFYLHDGVDGLALSRAVLANVADGGISQGGGTITMQLARNAYLRDRSKTISRKLEEIVTARALERRYTKDEILEQYLNTVYFGDGAYGIKTAAETFFGKSPAKLTLGEAALLVGVVRSPLALNPRHNLTAALGRRARVLGAMEQLGVADPLSVSRAKSEPVRLVPRRESNGVVILEPVAAPFVEFVRRELSTDPRLGSTAAERNERLFRGGLRIETTLDLRQQRKAAAALRSTLSAKRDPAGSLVSLEPRTGFIRAMANVNAPSSFNVAVQGHRQPGSTFKIFALVAALERNISPMSVYDGSSPKTLKFGGGSTWTVRNYEGSAGGRMTLLKATENSVNTVFAQLAQQVGPPKIVEVARDMGITSPLDAYPSIALGALRVGVSPLEMASAYATLANRGVAVRPMGVTRVLGTEGAVVLENRTVATRVLARDVADAATAILEQVVLKGTGGRARGAGRPVAAKTGTTDDYHDAWFVGFAAQASTAVWMGYPGTSRPLYGIHGYPKVFGGSLPASMWTSFMRSALSGLPSVKFAEVDLATFGKSSASTVAQNVKVNETRSVIAPDASVAPRPAPSSSPAPAPSPTPSSAPTPKPAPSPTTSPKPQPAASPSPSPSASP